MFRTPRFVKKTEYAQFNLDTPLTFSGNNQTQRKNGKKFSVKYRDNFYDWYNAYFHIDFKFEATANGGNVAADTKSAPINGSFSLIKSMTVKSAVKKCLRGHWPSQGYLYQKIAGLFWQLFQKRGQKPVLVPWYRRHHRNMTCRNKPTNPSKRAARTRWQQGRSASAPKPLLFLWLVFRPAFASKAAGVQDSAAGLGRQRNDF